VREISIWRRVLGLSDTTVEDVCFDEDAGALVVSVRPHRRVQRRCGRCGQRGPLYDRGEGRRRWRGLDLGTIPVWLEADAPRVSCRVHGPTVVQFPWARHGAGHSRDFDATVAWLAVRTSKSAACELMRIAWRTVGAIIARVQADVDADVDRLDGLRRIGIDEISWKRGQRYITVVVDHDTGRLVWGGVGRGDTTLHGFFDALGEERTAQITHVSADGADWIARVVSKRCPGAVRCADPFHVVAWATEALDKVRRAAWNDAKATARGEGKRRTGRPARHDPPRPGHQRMRALRRVRFVLWKNPENLTEQQSIKLDWIAKTEPSVYRAYLLKEALRTVFALKGDAGKAALERWISWARRSRIPEFVQLQRRIVAHRGQIEATLNHQLSNALAESTNAKIRLLTRIAYGFKEPEHLIALAILALGGHRPQLPGRK
jgi:transposase